jgi:hypothetical protein
MKEYRMVPQNMGRNNRYGMENIGISGMDASSLVANICRFAVGLFKNR